MTEQSFKSLDRRTVLKAAGVTVGATAVASLTSSLALAAERPLSLPKKYKAVIGVRVAQKFEDTIEIRDVPMPALAPDDVLVRNIIAGVAGSDITNTPQKFGLKEAPWPVGVESVGEVAAVGSAVMEFKPGQKVFVHKYGGAYAEYRVAKPTEIFAYEGISDEFASTLNSSLCAYMGLHFVCNMASNEVVFASAAAGGVGTFIVQLAKAAGNHVIGSTSRDEKVAFLRQIGCDRGINYNKENIGEVLAKEYPKGIDIAFDTVGGETYDMLAQNLAIRGRLVTAGSSSTYTVEGAGVGATNQASAPPRFRGGRGSNVYGSVFNAHFHNEFPTAIKRLGELQAAGKVSALIDDRKFKGLGTVKDAVPFTFGGGNMGKVIVTI